MSSQLVTILLTETSHRHVVAGGWVPPFLHCTTAYCSETDVTLYGHSLAYAWGCHKAYTALLDQPDWRATWRAASDRVTPEANR